MGRAEAQNTNQAQERTTGLKLPGPVQETPPHPFKLLQDRGKCSFQTQ